MIIDSAIKYTHFLEPVSPTIKYFALFPARMFKLCVDSTWDLAKSVTWQVVHFSDKVMVKTYTIAYIFFLKTRVTHLYDAAWYGIKNFLSPPSPQAQAFQNIYWALGAQKWREYVDYQYHEFGRNVFETGSHGGPIEIGYINSQERAAMYISDKLGEKMTAHMYQKIHGYVAGHFMGDDNNVCMHANNAGVFRREYVDIHFNCGEISPEALAENNSVTPQLYTLEALPKGGYRLNYLKRSSKEIEEIFNQFTDAFYAQIEQASTDREKLIAIAWYYKKLELCHPPWDGSGRTNYAVVQKLLVEHGFTPTIFEDPNKHPSSLTVNQIVDKLLEGITRRRNLLM